MDKSIQQQWDAYLIDAWFKQKSLKMWMIVKRFAELNNLTFDDVCQLKRTPVQKHEFHQDIFSYFGSYFLQVNNILLATKPKDVERIDKIVMFFGKQLPYRDKKTQRYQQNAVSKSRQDRKLAAADTITYALIKEAQLENGGHSWGKVK